MKFLTIRNLTIGAIICLAAIIISAFALLAPEEKEQIETPPAPKQEIETPIIETPPAPETSRQIISYSVQNRPIEAREFGTGDKLLIFVGAIHGGYEWNTALLADEFIGYFESNPELIPENLSVAIIPALNPDGLFKITGKEEKFSAADIPAGSNEKGRFNANNVDLNRNFNCNWKEKAVWRQQAVSAGAAPFSEPEAAAFRDYILKSNPAAVVFWHSQANAVYGSMCNADMPQKTREILNIYAKASGYPAVDTFTQYEVSGDATDWLASIGIPAITVELATRQNIEWQKNLAGVNALFEYFK